MATRAHGWMGRRCGATGAVLLLLTALGLGGRADAQRGGRPERGTEGAAPPLDSRQLSALAARYIGPVGVSGRVNALAVVEAHPATILAGTAGGVWRTRDGGATWRPVFDGQPAAAIGALAIYQASPGIVWAGTGEANLHVTAAAGNGVYRSLDGGTTWSWLGLGGSGHIARIVLDPGNPDVAWVAATGPMWTAGGERGVYRTEDGGRSWSRVLFVDDATGAGDLAIDPGNPRRLLANMWQVRRRPWELRSGGPGSGLYLSEDGGSHWSRLGAAAGLPGGLLGRMKLAFSPSRPRTAYALVEADRAGVLLRSEDGGRGWQEVDRRPNLFPRPFYFAEMKVDPRRPERLYSLHFNLDVSEDGGRSWEPRMVAGVHPDLHALWLDPADPEHLLVATDGGVYESRDGGRTAERRGELPVAQVNRLAADLQVPYQVYAGTQDNGSWRGPSAGWESGGIPERGWEMLGDSDGNIALPDPTRSGQGYALAQNGELTGWNLTTGEWRDLRPRPPAEQLHGAALRFGWTTPLALDPFAPSTLYCGSQFLLRSADRGATWTAISPDLTTDDPAWQHQDESGGLTPDVGGAEMHTTLSAIAPSPLAPGTLWVGTDDGRLHLTRDGGATWQSLESRVPEAPLHAQVAQIRASPFAAGAALVLLDNHRQGDDRPYVYSTADFGVSWRRLDGAPLRGQARAIVQDPVDPDLLFLGTQAGLWVSFDAGSRWVAWPAGAAAGELPPAPVADLAIQPRSADLVIATHGRGIYVIDDISPLRHLTAAALAEPLHLFPVAEARQHWLRFQDVGGRRGPHGEEPPYGALLTFWLGASAPGQPAAGSPAAPAGPAGLSTPSTLSEIEVRVTGAEGRPVRSFTAAAHPGLNRLAWGLEHDSLVRPARAGGRGALPATAAAGPEVPPGTYRATVVAGTHQAWRELRVLPDPRSSLTAAERQVRWAALWRVEQLRLAVVEAAERVRRARADLAALVPGLPPRPAAPAAPGPPAAAGAGPVEAGAAAPAPAAAPPAATAGVEAGLASLEAVLLRSRREPLGAARHDLGTRLVQLGDDLGSGMAPPSPGQLADLREAEGAVAAALARVNRFFAEQVAPLRAALAPADPRLLAPEPALALPATAPWGQRQPAGDSSP
jgi:photosystem II stability/assembly factor-like uncharacterized protein